MKNKNLSRILSTNQRSIGRGTGMPSHSEGRDGDITVRWVPSRGLYLLYKWASRWYGTKLQLNMDKALLSEVSFQNKKFQGNMVN